MSDIPAILQELYFKNLAFFEKQNPQIYEVLTNTKPDHSNIVISEDGKIDLIYNGASIYAGDAISYVESEVKEFNALYKEDKRLSAINAMKPGIYTAPRFFHKHLDKTIFELYKIAGSVTTNVLHTGKRHDFVIMMGIGLGLQITELLEKTNIQNILILETDYELLALSCFFTDWEEIYNIQSTKHKKSISLLLLNNLNLDSEQGSLWNELVKRAPHFPYNTVFYNHGRHNKYGNIIRKISKDIKMFMSLWGYYDDETNQLNHIMHNLKRGIKLIPSVSDFRWKKPVIVCGSGPSLDNRIDQLKSIREKCILLSAGTSLPVLLKNNLTPDFHIEIESDYTVYNALSSINKNDELSKITLICAIQCSPYITELFKDCYAFIKESMSIGDIIEKQADKLKESTPTCVNAATSIALQYKASQIFLFGTDFGFYSQENHHSKHTIYIDESKKSEEDKKIKDANLKNLENTYKEDGYLGECNTTSIYYTTKRRIEMAIKMQRTKYNFEVFNCSDGLIIENSTHIKQDSNINIDLHSEQEDFLMHCRTTKKTLYNDLIKSLHPPILELTKLLIHNIKRMENNTYSLSATCWSISNYINTTYLNKHGSITFFIRGTIWHYMISGYSIAYSCEPYQQEKVINLWKNRFIDFLEKLPSDLSNVLNKDRTSLDNDRILRKTIREKLDD